MVEGTFDLIKRIRWHINETEKRIELLENHLKWSKLTSALNVLEDTSWAIEYYRNTEYPSCVEGKYLFTYGLLQALYMEGDAIKSISLSLFGREIHFKENYPEIYKIREMRDDVLHPTNRRGHQFINLIQISLKKDSLIYNIKDEKIDEFESIGVNVKAAIESVIKCVYNILEESVKDLDREFTEYVDKHRNRKMTEIFKDLNYAKEKVFDYTEENVLLNAAMKNWGYEETKRMVEKCESELIKRYGSIEVNASYKHNLDAIHNIYKLIDTGPRIPGDLTSQIEKCLFENLFSKLEELRSLCESTDYYFENYGMEPTEPPDIQPVVPIPDIGD